MVFEKIFAKVFGKKEENDSLGGETIQPVETPEIKSVDEMEVGLEGVDSATKDLSEEAKEKIESFDTEAPVATDEVKTEEPMAEVQTEVKTEEPAIQTENPVETPTETPTEDSAPQENDSVETPTETE